MSENHTTDQAHGFIVEALADLEQLAPIPDAGIRAGRVFNGPTYKVHQIALAAGGELPDHSAPRPVVIHVIDGSVDFTIGDDTRRLDRGAIIVLEPSVAHSVTGVTASRLLLTLIG